MTPQRPVPSPSSSSARTRRTASARRSRPCGTCPTTSWSSIHTPPTARSPSPRDLGARVVERPFPGYGEQKRFGETACQHHWMLNIDADEVIPPDLAAGDPRALGQGRARRRRLSHPHRRDLPRRGRAASLRLCAGAGPALHEERKGTYNLSTVHDRVDLVPGARVAKLRGTIHHFSVRSLGDQMAKLNAYTRRARRRSRGARREHLGVPARAGIPGQLHQGLYRPQAHPARRVRLHDGDELRVLSLSARRQAHGDAPAEAARTGRER